MTLLDPLRRGLFGKLVFAHVAVIFITLLVLGVSFSYFVQNFYIENKKAEMVRQASDVASVVSEVLYAAPGGLSQILGFTARFVSGPMWVVDRNGLILASNMGHETGLRLEVGEIQQVLDGQVVTKVGRTPQFARPMLAVAVPVKSARQVLGAVLVYTPLVEVTATARQVVRLVLYGALIAVAIAAVVGWILARSLSQPLREMAVAAQFMARGDFTHRVQVKGDDEVSELAAGFNHLADALQETLGSLYEEQGKVESILASMGEGVVAVDHRGVVMKANPQALRLFELQAEQVTGQTLQATFPPELSESVLTAVVSGEVHIREITVGERVLLVHAAPIRSGRVGSGRLGAVAVLQDVSERWRLEQMRREFVANVSHEFRTPLTSIQGFVEAILDGVVTAEDDRRRYLRIVLEETQRLTRLVGDLLHLARLEARDLELEVAPTDVAQLVHRCVEKLTPVAQQAGVVVSVRAPEGLPRVLADADRIEQVVLNLLDNAIRHTPNQGEVVVSAAAQPGAVRVSVADTGSGLPPEDLPFVWERFYKGDKARSRSDPRGGTGLGLSICKQIVELHRGRVGVYPSPGSGTTFYFEIPA